MKWMPFAALFVLGPAADPARGAVPLHDPVALNIGLSCQWKQACINKQRKAMKRALSYVKKAKPPAWRIQLCNRNAARRGYRVDWIGFNNCVRNADLRPPPQRSTGRRRRSSDS